MAALASSNLEVSFAIIKWSANEVVDALAKMDVRSDNLVIDNCISLAL